jgi:hypothetical protein
MMDGATPSAGLNNRAAPVYDRPDDDWYVDPVWCTELLIQNERFPGAIWDPCAGGGNIGKAFDAAGRQILSTDAYPKAKWIGKQDFMANHSVRSDCIVFNPPYRDAEQFIRRALDLSDNKVAALVQQQFPYSQARHRLFTETPIARLYFFSSRPSMPPGRLLQAGEIEAKGGKTDYLWCVWEHGHRGAPQAFWLKREVV